jgi:hypothetical protein
VSQLPDPTGRLTPEAEAVYADVVGSRGHDYPGLFRCLMNYPALAERFAHFGKLLRFEGLAWHSFRAVVQGPRAVLFQVLRQPPWGTRPR